MEDRTCPACRSDNEPDASYCDQCGQPLSPPKSAKGADDEGGGCPACGGEVEDRGGGNGVCRSCGLELSETPEEESEGDHDDSLAGALIAAILAKIRAGKPMDSAVAESCRQVLKSAGAAPAAAPAPGAPKTADAPNPCPVCGTSNPPGAERCSECEVWFSSRHRPGECPSCGETASGDKCACGAFLTAPAAAGVLDSSAKFLCSVCKQPFVAAQAACPDCGGSMISADRLRAYARAHASS